MVAPYLKKLQECNYDILVDKAGKFFNKTKLNSQLMNEVHTIKKNAGKGFTSVSDYLNLTTFQVSYWRF
jgi:hypothetical protein